MGFFSEVLNWSSCFFVVVVGEGSVSDLKVISVCGYTYAIIIFFFCNSRGRAHLMITWLYCIFISFSAVAVSISVYITPESSE